VSSVTLWIIATAASSVPEPSRCASAAAPEPENQILRISYDTMCDLNDAFNYHIKTGKEREKICLFKIMINPDTRTNKFCTYFYKLLIL